MENSYYSHLSFEYSDAQPFSAAQQPSALDQPQQWRPQQKFDYSTARTANMVQQPAAANQLAPFSSTQCPLEGTEYLGGLNGLPVQQPAALYQPMEPDFTGWQPQASSHFGGQIAQPVQQSYALYQSGPLEPAQRQSAPIDYLADQTAQPVQQLAAAFQHQQLDALQAPYPGFQQAQQAVQPGASSQLQQHQRSVIPPLNQSDAGLAEAKADDGCIHKHANPLVVAARVALCNHLYNHKGTRRYCKDVGPKVTRDAVKEYLQGEEKLACNTFFRRAQRSGSQHKCRNAKSQAKKG